jgi:hypothetical protein
MWTSPIYKFNRAAGFDRAGNRVYEQIVIDVTGSAPSFSTPGTTLQAALDLVVTETGIRKNAAILDFGAGKLRNALYLLGSGYRVWAVEFEDLFKTNHAKSQWNQAKRYRERFSTLIYPHQFQRSDQTFDLILLINVLNVMPVPAERLLVLQYCQKKLRPGGYIFWYTQRGDADYAARLVPSRRLGDGHYIGAKTRYKTFYREYTVGEIDALFSHTGFEFVRAIPATSRNQARLFRRDGSAPLAPVLTPSKIKAACVVDDTIPLPEPVKAHRGKRRKPFKPPRIKSRLEKTAGQPDPDKLKIPKLSVDRLPMIPLGRGRSARAYQDLVKVMLEELFSPHELRDFQIEVDVFGRIKRLDILATNKSQKGFFYSLNIHHGIRCPTVVIECKNYQYELGNPEFDQLGSRLGKKLGKVGILAYRSCRNAEAVIERCRIFWDNEEKIIIPLSDKDFTTLLKLRLESKDDEIETFLDRLLFRIKAE